MLSFPSYTRSRLRTRFWSRFARARDGVETIEFALISVALFTFLLGIVEFGRLYWTQSGLQDAAEATARCVTVNCCNNGPAICGGSSGTAGYKNYAAGQVLGVPVAGSDLSSFTVTAANCGNQVSFDYTFAFIVGQLLPVASITLSTTGCHQA